MHGGLQRVGFLTAAPEVLREMGADVEQVLLRAGIDPVLLTDPENLLPYTAMGALLHEGMTATGREDFGLCLGAAIRLDTFGGIGRLVANAPSVGQAVTDFAENQRRHVRGAVVYQVMEGDTVVIGYAAYQPRVPALAQLYDCAMIGTANLMQEVSGQRPDEVWLPRRQPADPTPWHNSFKVPVRFNCEQAAIVYPRAVLSRPVPGASAAVRRIAAAAVETYWLVEEPSVADRVVRLLRPHITLGETTLREIADRMGLHPRTLNRRLQSEGTSYRELLNQTRLNFAFQMLECTKLNVTQIGLMLNYADSAVFSHSFRRLTGQTPSDWRAEAWRGLLPEAALPRLAGG